MAQDSSRSRGRDDDRGSRGRDEDRSGRGRDGDHGSRDRGRDDDRSRRSSGRSSFEYKRRDADSVRKRGEQSGGDYDRILTDTVQMWKPNDGSNTIRIMPPTWDGADHFGFDVFVHYEVGPDNQSYLCLDKMKGEACPVCDERARAVKDGDTEYADKLKPAKRVLIYMIDRDHERDGPIVWSMPWTIDRDLCKLVVDKRSGEVLPIDDPESGYDIEFDRQGKGQRTQYIGLAVARRDSALGKDEWLSFIQENPLPSLLHFYDYDHIQHVFGGGGGKSEKKDSRDGDHGSRGRDLDREQNEGLRKVERGGRDEELTWGQVHDMTYDELCSIIDDKDLKINPDDSKSDAQLADWICEDLKIEESRKPANDSRAKLDEMRSRRRSAD